MRDDLDFTPKIDPDKFYEVVNTVDELRRTITDLRMSKLDVIRYDELINIINKHNDKIQSIKDNIIADIQTTYKGYMKNYIDVLTSKMESAIYDKIKQELPVTVNNTENDTEIIQLKDTVTKILNTVPIPKDYLTLDKFNELMVQLDNSIIKLDKRVNVMHIDLYTKVDMELIDNIVDDIGNRLTKLESIEYNKFNPQYYVNKLDFDLIIDNISKDILKLKKNRPNVTISDGIAELLENYISKPLFEQILDKINDNIHNVTQANIQLKNKLDIYSDLINKLCVRLDTIDDKVTRMSVELDKLTTTVQNNTARISKLESTIPVTVEDIINSNRD